jgi:hypothetical protein
MIQNLKLILLKKKKVVKKKMEKALKSIMNQIMNLTLLEKIKTQVVKRKKFQNIANMKLEGE